MKLLKINPKRVVPENEAEVVIDEDRIISPVGDANITLYAGTHFNDELFTDIPYRHVGDEFNGRAIYLDPDYDYELGKNSEGSVLLVVLKKKTEDE